MKQKYMAPIVVSMNELDRSTGKGSLPNSNGNSRRNSIRPSSNSKKRAYS